MTSNIDKAARLIKNGGVVAFPTETVYGFGADATNEEACAKIYKIKGRPSINPLIVHVASLDQAMKIGEFNEDALKLAKLWPGPLTIIVPLKNDAGIATNVTAGLSTIGLRIPAHPLALELIKKSRRPIAAPSANLSGYISATLPEHIKQHFTDEEVFLLASSKPCQYGLESTIIDVTTPQPTILRYGFITQQTIKILLGKEVSLAPPLMAIKAPGMLDKHYSPYTPIRLNALHLEEGEIALDFGDSKLNSAEYTKDTSRVGRKTSGAHEQRILNRADTRIPTSDTPNLEISQVYSLNLSTRSDLIEAARNLYSMLRRLDDYAIANQKAGIAIAPIPKHGVGAAINDRLMRGARR